MNKTDAIATVLDLARENVLDSHDTDPEMIRERERQVDALYTVAEMLDDLLGMTEHADDAKTTRGNVRLLGTLYKAAEAEVETLRKAMRELLGAARTDVDPSGRPFEPGEFHEHVERVAAEALGEECGEPEAEARGVPSFCEECDGPCDIDR